MKFFSCFHKLTVYHNCFVVHVCMSQKAPSGEIRRKIFTSMLTPNHFALILSLRGWLRKNNSSISPHWAQIRSLVSSNVYRLSSRNKQNLIGKIQAIYAWDIFYVHTQYSTVLSRWREPKPNKKKNIMEISRNEQIFFSSSQLGKNVWETLVMKSYSWNEGKYLK